MASQTVALRSSFTPKLSTFNSLTPTLLPPPPTFRCSSSLPTPCRKASYGVIRVSHTSHFNHFKCHATPSETVTDLGSDLVVLIWEDVKDVEHNQQIQALGKFAVEEHNKKEKTAIKFIRVVEAEALVPFGGKCRLWIEGEVEEKVGKVDKVFKALVVVGLPVYPKDLKSFVPVEWRK